ncbi:uncharacterized protein TNCV_1167051 [Trichonephila clavipes]|uniref:Uncharacterized protein n=1 Tax=Trichonephila clavipes TaxID=2585209 RepID=A0A8X6VT87_TRICX|nr:uncharacterized protein TNCV_1167051 [Trichonephila clavipes]
MPGKRARRHFSQLSEFERSLIIGMKTTGWSTHRVAVNTRRYPRVENLVWSDQEDHEERGSKDRAASTCGPHSDSFDDRSSRRCSNCSSNNFQTPCKNQILNPSALFVHSL